MKIGFLSDLHLPNNEPIPYYAAHYIKEVYDNNNLDMLFLAGDTGNNFKKTADIVDLLSREGLNIYYVLGNHEYWSASYQEIQSLNLPRYINGKTVELNDDWVVIGLDGMFDFSFVTKVNNSANEKLAKDYNSLVNHGMNYFDLTRLKIGDYNEVFEAMKIALIEQLEANKNKNIILMLHHVPTHHAIHYSEFDNVWNGNNAFMGSTQYAELAEAYNVKKVIFGHTHTNFNETVNEVSYHCNPVGYGNGYEFSESFQERMEKQLLTFEI